MKNPAVAGLFCALFLIAPCLPALAQEAPAAANSELEAALETVPAAEAAATAPASAPSGSLEEQAGALEAPSTESISGDGTSLPPDAAILNAEPVEEEHYGMSMAFLLPAADSPLEGPTQAALQGLLAANYASEHPVQVLLVRPGANGSAVDQLKAAARAGAQVAVGPLDRQAIDEIAKLHYLPLPLVTLNEIDLNYSSPMSEEEIVEERRCAQPGRMPPSLKQSKSGRLRPLPKRKLTKNRTPAVEFLTKPKYPG